MGDVLDWDDLSDEDKERAEGLLNQLNLLFKKYEKKEDKPCEDSISPELKMSQESPVQAE